MKKIAILLIILLLISHKGLAKIKEGDLAREIHESAWHYVASQAREMQEYKYAIYMSRSIAVKHPEIYLQADALFEKDLKTIPNMAALYELTEADALVEEELFQQIMKRSRSGSGKRFAWKDFTITSFESLAYKDLYPGDNFLPFVDLRMPFLGSSLKSIKGKTPPLAMAAMLYFQLKADRNYKNPYILMDALGEAYVAVEDRKKNEILFDHCGAVVTESIKDAILIFNEKRVWYPLMGRDDTSKTKRLAKLRELYGKEDPFPKLSGFEGELISLLQEATALTRGEEKWALFHGKYRV